VATFGLACVNSAPVLSSELLNASQGLFHSPLQQCCCEELATGTDPNQS
jgi:hypothetical protein